VKLLVRPRSSPIGKRAFQVADPEVRLMKERQRFSPHMVDGPMAEHVINAPPKHHVTDQKNS